MLRPRRLAEDRGETRDGSRPPSLSGLWYLGSIALMVREVVGQQTRNELGQALNGADFASVYVAVAVHCDAFTHAAVAAHTGRALGHVLGDEEPYVASAGAADSQAFAPARVVVVIGFRIDGVQHVVRVDVNATDAAELIPSVQVITFLIKNLDAAVAPVGDKQPTLGVKGHGVRSAHLAILVTPFTPAHQVGAIRRVFGDTADSGRGVGVVGKLCAVRF